MKAIDMSHYQRARSARLDAGVSIMVTNMTPIAFVGKTMTDVDSHRQFVVEGMRKYWVVDGWIYVADLMPLNEDSSDHIKVFWSNINSTAMVEDDFMYKKFVCVDEQNKPGKLVPFQSRISTEFGRKS